jgi:hypothetical protein
MSKRGFVILAGLIPATLGAQNAQLLRERLAREFQISARATRELAAYQSFERRFRTATDTIVIAGGNITVLTHRNIAPTVRAAAAEADTVLRAVEAVLPRVRGGIFYAELDSSGGRYRSSEPVVLMQFILPPNRNPTGLEAQTGVKEIARVIEGTVMQRAVNMRRTPFTAWRRGNLPLRVEDVERQPSWEGVRFDILETRSVLGPRCYRGDIAACSMQLGLTRVEDPVMSWYDSVTRIATVKERELSAKRYDGATTERCLAGNDSECASLLRRLRTFENAPAGGASRDALVWQAIKMGGEGAAQRLLMSEGTPAEALAAAAKAPTDSIIKLWQRNVREGGIGSDSLSVRMVIVAIGWIALLLFLSTRISRWR